MSDRDRKLFLHTLGEASERFKLDVFAFVLMDNHYHLLLRTNERNLSRAMQWVGLTYARRLNNRLKRSGHLFQGRFKAILVENDAYIIELSCYIHRNPLRAGMVKRLIDHRWSSYPVFAYGRKGPAWLKTDLILSSFSGREEYRKKVQSYAEEEDRVWENLRHGLLLGGENFLEKIRSVRTRMSLNREVPQQRKVMASIDAMSLAKRGAAILGRDMGEYNKGRRLRGEAKTDRDALVYSLWGKGLFRNEEIGSLFGISYSAVSHIIAGMKFAASDQQVRKKLRKINSQFKM